MNRPGGSFKTNETVTNSSLAAFTNEKDINNKLETCFSLMSTQKNALQRVRSSNIIKPNYCVDSKQYLQKRGITIEQNQYNYLRSGDSSTKPGTINSLSNVYDGQKSDCLSNNVIYKPRNSQFACDGSVTSSSLLLKKKNDAISKSYGTTNANQMKKSFNTEQYCTKYR